MADGRRMFLFLFVLGLVSALGVGLLVNTDVTTPSLPGPPYRQLAAMDRRPQLIVEVQQQQVFSHTKPHPAMDQALISIHNNLSYTVHVWSQVDACWKCPLLLTSIIQSGHMTYIHSDTRWPVELSINKGQNTPPDDVICSLHHHFGEYGEYTVGMGEGGDTCGVTVNKEPVDPNIPIYIAGAVLVLCSILYTIGYQVHRKKLLRRLYQCHGTEGLIDNDLGTANSSHEDLSTERPAAPQSSIMVTKPRIRSLDTFRGFCLLVMVLVNYGGGGYWFFKHSKWNGLTVADLVFPWFTFIMGTSIALSVRSLLRRGNRRLHLMLKVIKRTTILFALGLLISNTGKNLVNVTELRIPGVLQRLAISYLVVALLEVCFAQAADVYQAKWWASVRDLVTSWHEWLIALSILTIHIGLTFLLPVPDCPRGYLGPGGISEDGLYENCTGGAAGYIDRMIFTDAHIYNHPTCKKLYLTSVAFDPEGILGTLTSIFICFLGLQAGKILNTYPSHMGRILRWIAWSIFTGGVAGLLCQFSQNDGWIPVNKNLWSVSFILGLASLAFLFLSLCYFLCDVIHVWSGAPFFYPGMNSILIYLGHELLHRSFPVQFHVPPHHGATLALHLYGAALWLIVSVVLYHKRIFIAI